MGTDLQIRQKKLRVATRLCWSGGSGGAVPLRNSERSSCGCKSRPTNAAARRVGSQPGSRGGNDAIEAEADEPMGRGIQPRKFHRPGVPRGLATSKATDAVASRGEQRRHPAGSQTSARWYRDDPVTWETLDCPRSNTGPRITRSERVRRTTGFGDAPAVGSEKHRPSR